MTDSALAGRIRDALGTVIDPELHRPVTDLGMIAEVEARDGEQPHVRLELTISGCPAARHIEAATREAIETVVEGPYQLDVGVMTPQRRAELVAGLRGGRTQHPFGEDSLTRVVAVSSGKGGVGKSTVTVNLAVALAAAGLRVGIVDADVHGYSVPGLLGMGPDARPTPLDDLMLPPQAHGVAAVSIGMFLAPGEEVVAWRGPMLHRTLEQFLRDVHFGDLDVLLIDLPPGTGDIALSMAQLLPEAEVLVVTTPQPAASEVARRSGALAAKTGQHLIGVIETLSPAIAADGSRLDLFGEGGGRTLAQELGVPLLAEVPISAALRAAGDEGTPIVLAEPSDPAAVALTAAAEAIAHRPRGLAHRSLPLHTS